MARVSLRNAAYQLISADPEMISYGYDVDHVYAGGSPDSPEGPRFLIIKWGTTTRGVGRANTCDMTVWTYDKSPDYTYISLALNRLQVIVPTLIGVLSWTDGSPADSCLGADWGGEGEDLFDDAYRAWHREGVWRMTASGG